MHFWHAGVITVEIGPKLIPKIIDLTAESCFKHPSGVHTLSHRQNHLAGDVKIKHLHLEGSLVCVRAAAESAYGGEISSALKNLLL